MENRCRGDQFTGRLKYPSAAFVKQHNRRSAGLGHALSRHEVSHQRRKQKPTYLRRSVTSTEALFKRLRGGRAVYAEPARPLQSSKVDSSRPA